MTRINLSRPGEEPTDGDFIEETRPSGAVVRSHYFAPIVPPVDEILTHKTEFSPAELLNAFTTEEAFLAAGSTDPFIQRQMKVLSFKRSVTIQATDASYQNAINALEANGVLTAERAADLRPGLPG